MLDIWDVIVVGSGAGGAAAAYKLVKAGKRVLMIEKGGRLPSDRTTLSTKIVFKEGRLPDVLHKRLQLRLGPCHIDTDRMESRGRMCFYSINSPTVRTPN
jgi:choline dehydrogenase-like flavoprotein